MRICPVVADADFQTIFTPTLPENPNPLTVCAERAGALLGLG